MQATLSALGDFTPLGLDHKGMGEVISFISETWAKLKDNQKKLGIIEEETKRWYETKIDNAKFCLLICGLPGSGKTSFIRSVLILDGYTGLLPESKASLITQTRNIDFYESQNYILIDSPGYDSMTDDWKTAQVNLSKIKHINAVVSFFTDRPTKAMVMAQTIMAQMICSKFNNITYISIINKVMAEDELEFNDVCERLREEVKDLKINISDLFFIQTINTQNQSKVDQHMIKHSKMILQHCHSDLSLTIYQSHKKTMQFSLLLAMAEVEDADYSDILLKYITNKSLLPGFVSKTLEKYGNSNVVVVFKAAIKALLKLFIGKDYISSKEEWSLVANMLVHLD